ncbi:hypothetical protein HYH96_04840 [Clostridium botulinum]|uniref:hypothetical protein n=1 Tax=Clostridium botulinum TaxID=1491 RepID=UPI00174A2369|nr:hypothetical protein [Clostridium botulinum]MBD5643220.1 hypothetical protein [Clostridium botulinum]
MNTREQAEKKILEFLNSENRTMVLSGTHMFKKHKLILNILAEQYENLKILFRVNSLKNTNSRDFFGFEAQTGRIYELRKNILYIDSMNTKSWQKTPNDFDIIIFYPAGSLYNKNSLEVKNNLQDIFYRKNVNKIIFVTCQEGEYSNISYLKEYDDIVHIKYDSEEDDNEYHKRVVKSQCELNFDK